MTVPRSLGDSMDWSEVCGPLPGGEEIARGKVSLRIEIEGVIQFNQKPSVVWALRISKPRLLSSGRQGKPELIATLVQNPGQTVPDMLRDLADCWAQGETEIRRGE